MQQKHINIRLSTEEISDIFKQHLTGPNQALLADAILGLIDDDWKIERLFKATVGITAKSKFKLKTIVRIPINSMSSYNWDKDAMKERRMIIDDYIEGTLIEHNPWGYEEYKLSLKVIKDPNVGAEVITQGTRGEGMILAEEWPEFKKKPDDDLPF